MITRESRTESINLRVTPAEKQALVRLARQRRTSLGGIIYPVVARMVEDADAEARLVPAPWSRQQLLERLHAEVRRLDRELELARAS